MITAIRNNFMFNNRCSNIMPQRSNNTNIIRNSNNIGDTVSFSGATKSMSKLSDESFALIKKFTTQLEPNKMYKFDPSIAEHFQLATVASKESPEARNLYVQYSAYSKDNSAKFLMFSVNNNGEVYENGNMIKNKKDIAIYENIIPELINKASKELKLSLK